MQDEHQLIVLCSESKYREVSSNWSSLELTHSAPTGRPGTLLPSRGPTKYLINGRNCDTISNEPFIEPHLDNPEIGIQASGGVPNQRIPARQRSCITNTIYLQLQRQHICHLSSCLKLPELSPDKLEVSSPEAPQQPLRPLHPGMLSAALQGTLPPSHQPPTPPRTPQVVFPKQPQNDYKTVPTPRATLRNTKSRRPPSPCCPRCPPSSPWPPSNSRCLASLQVRNVHFWKNSCF